jgi:alpha-tubulin suppressor-like RCC1 family protein
MGGVRRRSIALGAVLLVTATACQPSALFGWGADASGQVGRGSTGQQRTPVSIDAPYRDISSGGMLGAAVDTEGSLWQWGRQPTNGGQVVTRAVPERLEVPGETFTSVSQGTDHLLALTPERRLICIGRDDTGQCSSSDVDRYTTGFQNTWFDGTTRRSDWRRAAAGDRFSLAIAADGSLWAWGDNSFGRLGLGLDPATYPARYWETRVGSGLWTDVSAGADHALGIAADGTLWAWGDNDHGQLGASPEALPEAHAPTQIGVADDWTSVSAGYGYSLARRADGTLWAWGRNDVGQLGIGTTVETDTPTPVGSAGDWKQVSAGRLHVLALKVDGSLWAWGDDEFGLLGDGHATSDLLYEIAGCEPGMPAVRSTPARVGSATGWQVVAAGDCTSAAIHGSGALRAAWGINQDNQSGDGTSASTGSVTDVAPVHDWRSVHEGRDHSVGIRADGTLWTWGGNTFGQLGDDTVVAHRAPTAVGSATWIDAAAGDGFTIAVRSDKTLWAWGRNDAGQLGDGTTIDRHAPVQIGVDNSWIDASAGSDHALARRSDGTIWAWGANDFGQLGDGTTDAHLVPAPIGTDRWKSISAGSGDSLALRADGTLWAWGLNACGELGDGTTSTRTAPTPVGGAWTWTAASAGRLHSAAVRSDGTLWAWGRNADGRLGDGTTTDRHAPVQVGDATIWRYVSAGYDSTVATRSDGTLWVWGDDSVGQLGDGSTVDRHEPVQLGSAHTWGDIADGSTRRTALALRN